MDVTLGLFLGLIIASVSYFAGMRVGWYRAIEMMIKTGKIVEDKNL